MADEWTVGSCECRHENEAARWLQHFGSRVYVPLREVEVHRAKTLSRAQRKTIWRGKVILPVFPGYIFVIDPRGPRGNLREIPGLRCILRGCGIDAAVKALREQETGGLVKVKENGRPERFNVGDIVRVSDGPFCGFPGTITEVCRIKLDGAERIAVDVNIFGRATPVELEGDQVEVVARATPSAVHAPKAA